MTKRIDSPMPNALLAAHGPAVGRIAERVRKVVLGSIPDVVERSLTGWGAVGFRTAEAGHICALFPLADEVRLYFNHGSELPDGAGVEFGDTPLTRYAIFRRPTDVKRATLAPLVLQAFAATAQRSALRRGMRKPKRRR